MKISLAVALLLLLSACGISGPPHSDYYVVTFDAGRAELPPGGRLALSYAASDADRGTPRAVAIKAYVRTDGSARSLSEQRMNVVADALVEAGVARTIIRLVPQRAADDAEFARLGDGVIVQIERGEPVAPPSIEEE